MNTDPIADYLTRLRNAAMVGHDSVEMPASKQKLALTQLLQKEGYLKHFEVREDKTTKHTTLRVFIKYGPDGEPVFRQLKRISKPGTRKYSRTETLPRILDGAGIAVISTSQGLMTDRQARKMGVGGEVLCTVY